MSGLEEMTLLKFYLIVNFSLKLGTLLSQMKPWRQNYYSLTILSGMGEMPLNSISLILALYQSHMDIWRECLPNPEN